MTLFAENNYSTTPRKTK